MSYRNPQLVDLFNAYTADPNSIGAQLTDAVVERGGDDPLIAATSTDVVLYPGSGKPPEVEGFRMSTRGFIELAAVSHLGPAVASLVTLRTIGRPWRPAAERLLATTVAARAANDVELWREEIAVAAFHGRERAIAAMVDYACAMTERYLRAALADDRRLTAETLRRDYLEGGPVPVNTLMIATFFLTGMDIAHRLMSWLGAQGIDWDRAMVVIAGQQGRPTSGVTWNTSSIAMMVRGASLNRLPMDRLYLAPHAPTVPAGSDLDQVAALEQPLRRIWANTRATAELGETMFHGYPRFASGVVAAPDLTDPEITQVAEMPRVHSPDDMRALVTRMRVVLEDPRQLLSGCVADYAVAQLVATGNDPSAVAVPGLTGVSYPVLS